jgi:predicted membrane chloride channel (bestrophin family)
MCVLLRLQASANTLTAHIVSIFFLTFMIRKVTAAYQRVLEVRQIWGGG